MGHAACRELCAMQDEILRELGKAAAHLTYVAPADERLEIKKYNPALRRHTVHKEIK